MLALHLEAINQSDYWNRKVRLLALAVATFIALC
jgi:hypothetical protein